MTGHVLNGRYDKAWKYLQVGRQALSVKALHKWTAHKDETCHPSWTLLRTQILGISEGANWIPGRWAAFVNYWLSWHRWIRKLRTSEQIRHPFPNATQVISGTGEKNQRGRGRRPWLCSVKEPRKRQKVRGLHGRFLTEYICSTILENKRPVHILSYFREGWGGVQAV